MLEEMGAALGYDLKVGFISLVWEATTREAKYMQNNETPQNAPSLEEEFDAVRQTLAHLTLSLRGLEDEVMAGEPASVREASKLLADIRTWSRLAIETEARFEKRRQEKEGIVDGYALDLVEARRTIGCRLARLRKCCRSG
ncbi:MAG: hypothetical protein JXQ85_06645 [Cognatishimia sp.]|uniref:hypothetical protein n=1 Tax=Cognatishimia sp. TaxID=2211648 RepID=UPI003B8BD176